MKSAMMLLLGVALIGFFGCKSDAGSEAKEPAATEVAQVVADEADTTVVVEPEIMTKESGVRYQDLVVGTGAEAVTRMQVECHYTLWFADSTGLVKETRFQSSKDGEGVPFVCQLGVRLIPGWSDGMVGMKEGGTRRIYVPWELGYGAQGGGPIPPKANLIFEIDFLKARS
jgi:FKBP-type peptidyl-prolyl cis-trans isomerase